MSRKKTPKMIDISSDQLDGITARISTNSLLDDDKRIVLAILSAYTWVQCQLERHKLSIKRLKNMFGFSTERRGKHKKKDPKDTSSGETHDGTEGTSPDENHNEVTTSKKHPSGTL